MVDHDGSAALHAAAESGHAEAAALLLDAGADARATTHCGDTPLHFAAREGHVAMCHGLLAHGVDARAVTRSGAAPLDEARRGGSECEAVVALLEAVTGEGGHETSLAGNVSTGSEAPLVSEIKD